MLYRALFTKSRTVRRMTFAHAGGMRAAWTYAERFALKGEVLNGVIVVREIARPIYQLALV